MQKLVNHLGRIFSRQHRRGENTHCCWCHKDRRDYGAMLQTSSFAPGLLKTALQLKEFFIAGTS